MSGAAEWERAGSEWGEGEGRCGERERGSG